MPLPLQAVKLAAASFELLKMRVGMRRGGRAHSVLEFERILKQTGSASLLCSVSEQTIFPRSSPARPSAKGASEMLAAGYLPSSTVRSAMITTGAAPAEAIVAEGRPPSTVSTCPSTARPSTSRSR